MTKRTAAKTNRAAADAARSAFADALAGDLDLLASLHDRELTPEIVDAARTCSIAEQLALRVSTPEGRAAVAVFDAALAEVPHALTADVMDELAAQYADVYLRYTYRLSPTESVWLTEDGLERQDPMFRVQLWYRRHGLKIDDPAGRPADHIVFELRFLSFLAGQSGAADGLAEVTQFLDQHLLRWMGRFAETAARYGAPPIYAGLAALTAAYLRETRVHLANITGVARPAPPADKPAAVPSVRELTCADPDEKPFVPGVAPSW